MIGISGGILLAPHGLHMNSCIVGIGDLGADNIPENIEAIFVNKLEEEQISSNWNVSFHKC